jgi:hypothetical protein
MKHYLRAAGAAIVLLVAPAVLHAAAIQVFVDPAHGATDNTGSSATITLNFTETGVDDILSIAVENTTPPQIGSRLTAVGLELPDLLLAQVGFAPGGAGAYFDELTFDVPVSPGWMNAPGGYDLMITSDRKFEGGSPLGAPTAGESETIVLRLGDTGLTPDQLSRLVLDSWVGLPEPCAIARFQAVGPCGEDSDKVRGNVPDPATLTILLAGGAVWMACGNRRSGRGS